MPVPPILTLREQGEQRDRWLAERLQRFGPGMLRAAGVDCWMISGRSFNEDPVLRSMLPSSWLQAPRRTTLLLFDRGGSDGVETLAVARYAVGDAFTASWDPDTHPDQWARTTELIAARGPSRIAVNTSPVYGLADGLTASERDAFLAALSPALRERVVPAGQLALSWLSRRLPTEVEGFAAGCRIAHAIMAEGLERPALAPGKTTTTDLAWWYRQRIAEATLTPSFQPSATVQRPSAVHDGSFADRDGGDVIRPGDLLHIDVGVDYLGFATDAQRHAYVLKPGETAAPAGLVAALAAANRVQDILCDHFEVGANGDSILAATRAQCEAEGLRPRIYTHPVDHVVHGAGPTIGLWDRQDGVPGWGEQAVLEADTLHAIELDNTMAIPEWGDLDVHIMLEEEAVYDGSAVRYVDGRQTELVLVKA